MSNHDLHAFYGTLDKNLIPLWTTYENNISLVLMVHWKLSRPGTLCQLFASQPVSICTSFRGHSPKTTICSAKQSNKCRLALLKSLEVRKEPQPWFVGACWENRVAWSVTLMSNAQQGAECTRGSALHSAVLDNEAVLWHWVQQDGVETQNGEEKKRRRKDTRSFSSVVPSHKRHLAFTVVKRKESDAVWSNPTSL